MYKNWKMLRTEINEEEYSQVAEWCNNSKYTINIDGEYFVVTEIPQPTEEEIKQQIIEELKGLLTETDYVVIKIMEGESTEEEYAEILTNRKLWRKEINELQQ